MDKKAPASNFLNCCAKANLERYTVDARSANSLFLSYVRTHVFGTQKPNREPPIRQQVKRNYL